MEKTQIWKEYEKGKDYLESIGFYQRVKQCHDFVIGQQWDEMSSTKERPPCLNILAPIMKTSTSLVGQNLMTVQYQSLNYGKDREMLLAVCDMLNNMTKKLWEQLKLDMYMWEILEDSFISGDSFIYFYDSGDKNQNKVMCELLDTTNIVLGDEQQNDIQKQPYILITQKRRVEEVREIAKRNNVSQKEFEFLKSNEKIDLIAKFYKKNGTVCISRSTETVIVQPETQIKGLKRYPIAQYTWKKQKNSARGIGDIWDKIPNQISVNKSLYRLEQAVKSSAYPIKVYRAGAIDSSQVQKLDQPGASIAVKGSADMPVNVPISYLNPANISPYAQKYWQDLIFLTKDLAGAGDNLENINPEVASGAAIQAALEVRSLTVNMQVSSYKQFAEDIAWIWFDMLLAYNPNGIEITFDKKNYDGKYSRIVPVKTLKSLDVDIKVDATHIGSAWSAIKDMQLRDMLEKGFITFEEYVDSLGDDTTMPKDALKKIVASRKTEVLQ